MTRFARTILAASVLILPLAACSDFDPTTMFDNDIFNPKKPLPGARKELFPSGTPGVPQGVPAELYKGYQAPVAEANPDAGQANLPPGAGGVRGKSPDAPEEQPRPKPKPKPKVAAGPAPPRSTPTSVTVQPSQPAAAPAAPYQWPDASQQNGQGAAAPSGAQPGWPNPPAPGTFGR